MEFTQVKVSDAAILNIFQWKSVYSKLIFKHLDVFEMILCGAAAVQVGTCHWNEGPKCFDRICEELRDIMESKGYQSIDEFKFKLKDWSKEGATLSRVARMKKKKQKQANETQNMAGQAVPAAANQIVSPLLMLIIAILLADKLDIISV